MVQNGARVPCSERTASHNRQSRSAHRNDVAPRIHLLQESLKYVDILEPRSSTLRMPAAAPQLSHLFCVLAVVGAIPLALRRNAATSRMRARLGRHEITSRTPSLRCAPTPPGCRYRLISIRCSACFRLVSVNFAPLSIRAISSTRCGASINRISVCVRPCFTVFSIKKC
jgi:hypothetical protein